MAVRKGRGDTGTTQLFGGRGVWKDTDRIEALGALDELVAFLGLAKASCRRKQITTLLEASQRELFLIGSEVACSPAQAKKLRERIGEEQVRSLECECTHVREALGELPHGFVLPGDTLCSSFLEVARTVARRAERRAVRLARKRHLSNKAILSYLNRLGDLLYLLARAEERRHVPVEKKGGKRST